MFQLTKEEAESLRTQFVTLNMKGDGLNKYIGKNENSGGLVTATVERQIFTIRGQAVMLDRDLAELYETATKVFNQAVKRNITRFPADFMFQLSNRERIELVTNCDRFLTLRHSTTNPYAFTEQGVAMLSSVLRSEKAIQVNIEIMRAFVRMKRALLADKELARRMEAVEKTVDTHGKRIGILSDIVRGLIDLPAKPRQKIGFRK